LGKGTDVAGQRLGKAGKSRLISNNIGWTLEAEGKTSYKGGRQMSPLLKHAGRVSGKPKPGTAVMDL